MRLRAMILLVVLCAAVDALTAQKSWTSYDDIFQLTQLSGVRAFNGDPAEYDSQAQVPVPALMFFDDSDWETVSFPQDLRDIKPEWGPVVWYRFSIDVPADQTPRRLTLALGDVADFDEVWFNDYALGKNGGYRGAPSNELYRYPRRYNVPAEVVFPGRPNLIVIRVEYGASGHGGIIGGDLSIASAEVKSSQLAVENLVKLIFVSALLFSAIAMFAFSFRVRELRVHLAFALLSFLMAVYFFCLTDLTAYMTDYPFWRKLQYVSLWICFPAALTFFVLFFRVKFRWHHGLYGWLMIGVSMFGLFVSDAVPLVWLNQNLIQPGWIYPIGTLVWLIVRNFRKSHEAKVMSVLSIGFVLFMVLDLLKSRDAVDVLKTLPYLSAFGAPIIVVSFSFYLISRQVYHYREHEDLYRMATTDSLTETTLRGHFLDRLSMSVSNAWRRGMSFALMMVDLDRFKSVNDRFGHPAGDIVLRDAAAVMKSQLRDSDYIGRYGGEEFLIFVPDIEKDGALALAERIRTALESHSYMIQGVGGISVSASIGLLCKKASAADEAAPTPEGLIATVDKALYAAKNEGRNRVSVV